VIYGTSQSLRPQLSGGEQRRATLASRDGRRWTTKGNLTVTCGSLSISRRAAWDGEAAL
jgi:hypothetical protein